MVQINAAQVEWLVANKPETEHAIEVYDDNLKMFLSLSDVDIKYCQIKTFNYYLTPETYNALPQTFKDLC
jgi:hypothetical protein